MSEELNKKGLLMVVTLLSIIFSIIPSLALWFFAKDSLEEPLKKYLTNLLNFEITMLVAGIIVGIIFPLLAGLVTLINLIVLIIGVSKLNKNEVYKFPMAIELIK